MAHSAEARYKMICNLDVTSNDLLIVRDAIDPQSGYRWTLVRDHRSSTAAGYGSVAIATDLTDEEAADAVLSHLFTDYASMSTDQVIATVKPMMLRDEAELTDVRRGAISYFYAKDQDSAGRAASLVAYGDALSMATAGSVEGCLEALMYMAAVGAIPAGDEAFTAVITEDLQEYLMKFPR